MVSINIKNLPFTYHAQLVNILDFNPEKLSVEEVCAINDELEYTYYIKYNNNPFYLAINNLKGYFRHSKEKNIELEFIIKDQEQAKIYNQIWNKIKKLISNVDGVNFRFSDYFRDHDIVTLDTDDILPLDSAVTICSVTIIIRSVYRDYYDGFYPQIYLRSCTYKVQILLFLR